ncbi:MAG: sigma 54-interacting transcriptional regulator, partial [Candidatus Eisenbacteria bacterium]|nr:sigma 54-interacting transcriptional regulator [Candidatus Eisenbacteria bacterium]MBU1947646.1 sigma 54-interacting transcriptional regulator [Candidatus Eisenbacteria bacterium]MBU2690378.1 sigma 54-interacting transcriptional regulator [Candidatus Eisenbacteria bacterium]
NRMGLLEQSLETFKQAHRQARQIGHSTLILRSALGLGMLAARSGDWQEARRLLLDCWRMARRMEMPREECLSLEFLGETLALCGRLPAAHRALNLCHRLATRLAPAGDLVVECTLRFSLLACAESQWQRAEEWAQDAIDLASKCGMDWEEAQGWGLLSLALEFQSKEDKAAQADLRAKELFREMGRGQNADLVGGWRLYLMRIKKEHRDPEIQMKSSRSPSKRSLSKPVKLDSIWEKIGLITGSIGMIQVLEQTRHLAEDGAFILLVGETGTGKELVARGIHDLAGRKGRFVPFNCGACPDALILSELFGAEQGAFTGAIRNRHGLVREAEEGTLFLDEVGELSPRAQVALLRFLDHGEVRALGSTRIRNVQLGIVAATQRTLLRKLRSGDFRRDLFYRLAQGLIDIPPLRDRLEDLPLLIRHFWKRGANGDDPEMPEVLIEEKGLRILREYAWPGNIRELDHFVRGLRLRWKVLKTETSFDLELIREALAGIKVSLKPDQEKLFSREEVKAAIKASKGSISRAARLLGISRQKLYRILG